MSAVQNEPDTDVLIVGAGISGIGMAARLEMECPDRRYTLCERRDALGGTWDLFRYPGVRSDSDMHTLGFDFEPWRHEKSIADGDAILEYLHRIVKERDIRAHIRFSTTVISADFSHKDAFWTVTVETGDGERKRLTARWLYLGSGYYDYDQAYDPGFDTSRFEGRVIHPQFWPDDLDHADRQVVVIGSGATAVTIVPAMAKTAAQVTMLQRTPTWMIGRPARDRLANTLRRWLPEKLAYRITRLKNILMQNIAFKRAQSRPEKVADFLTGQLKEKLGPAYEERAFTPPYDPWDQRLCLVPDDDLFEALRSGRARIVTGSIAAFEETGVRLSDGRTIPADIIVTATGLKLAVAGKIAISVDGDPVDFAERWYYKGCMFSNLPNLGVVFGYLNASWTLRADLNSRFICRVLNTMAERGATVATPRLSHAEEARLKPDDVFAFSSGYLQRSSHIMPKNAVELPWRLNQDYLTDRKYMANSPVEDGVLTFAEAAPASDRMANPAGVA